LIVIDASAVLEALVDTPAGGLVRHRILSEGSVAAPHLLDLEVAQVLRRLRRIGDISESRAAEALSDLADLPIERHPHLLLMPRIWALRGQLSAYDASYVALAELWDATLLTSDRRLAAAAGVAVNIEVVA